jgi:hypothetical protein
MLIEQKQIYSIDFNFWNMFYKKVMPENKEIKIHFQNP